MTCSHKQEHFVYVAYKEGEPGARAACIDEPGYEEHLVSFMGEMVRGGCKIQRVNCDTAHDMLKEHHAWLDHQGPRCECPCPGDCDEAGECLREMGVV